MTRNEIISLETVITIIIRKLLSSDLGTVMHWTLGKSLSTFVLTSHTSCESHHLK